MPGGDRRLANVRKLMRIARRFEAADGRDLRRFIDHLDEREVLRAHEGEAPVEGEARSPAVRLMTIHAAKGLEFPVVCVADLGRPMRGGDDGGIQVAEDGRVGLRLASLSGESRGALEWERLKEEQDARAEDEEKRIFYVAMTRAEEHLVLSGATDLEKWPEPRRLRAPLDWIWRAVGAGGEGRRSGGPFSRCGSSDTRHPGRASSGFGPLRPARVQSPRGYGRRLAQRAPLGAPTARRVRRFRLPRLSYSSLESYRRCGYRFYLERVARPAARSTALPSRGARAQRKRRQPSRASSSSRCDDAVPTRSARRRDQPPPSRHDRASAAGADRYARAGAA